MTFSPEQWNLRRLRGQGTLSNDELQELLGLSVTDEPQLERALAPARSVHALQVGPELRQQLREILRPACVSLSSALQALPPELWAGMVAAERIPELMCLWGEQQNLDEEDQALLKRELQFWDEQLSSDSRLDSRMEHRLMDFCFPPSQAWVHVRSTDDLIWLRFIQSEITPARLNLRSVIHAHSPHLMEGDELTQVRDEWYEWGPADTPEELPGLLEQRSDALRRYLDLTWGGVISGPPLEALAQMKLPQVDGVLDFTQAALNTAVALSRLDAEGRAGLLTQSEPWPGGLHEQQAQMTQVALEFITARLGGLDREQAECALRDLQAAMCGQEHQP